jgi:uncharacterized membrane protein (DUF485 family)
MPGVEKTWLEPSKRHFSAETAEETGSNAPPKQKGVHVNAMPTPITGDNSQTNWDRIAESQEFKDLMATKKMFIVPAFVFFVVYYFALPALVGYAPHFMATKVIGNVNLAYLFALSQFFVAWLIAYLYVKAAGDFDRLAKDIIEKSKTGGK